MSAGRPLKYKTSKELQQSIDDYFNSCWSDKEIKDEFGNVKEVIKIQTRPYTVTGLALHLDLDRKGLLEYQGKAEYTNTIKKAKLKCENFAEECLFTSKNVTGVIFNLKNNYGWVDKQEVDSNINATNDNTNTNIDLSHLSYEQLKELIKDE